jgi:hypothetical protein
MAGRRGRTPDRIRWTVKQRNKPRRRHMAGRSGCSGSGNSTKGPRTPRRCHKAEHRRPHRRSPRRAANHRTPRRPLHLPHRRCPRLRCRRRLRWRSRHRLRSTQSPTRSSTCLPTQSSCWNPPSLPQRHPSCWTRRFRSRPSLRRFRTRSSRPTSKRRAARNRPTWHPRHEEFVSYCPPLDEFGRRTLTRLRRRCAIDP